MGGAFDLLQELADVVELKARAQAEIPRLDAKRFRRRGLAARGQASSQELVTVSLKERPERRISDWSLAKTSLSSVTVVLSLGPPLRS